MSFSDKEIVCEECSQAFIFTAGEQEFFSSKGLQNLPRRCNVCRQKRKLSTGSNEENFSYGRAVSYSGKTPRRLHIAPCSGSKSLSPECQEYTEVPFMPRGDRPIYCSSCYNVMKNAEAEAEADEKIETSASSENDSDTKESILE
ncbi:MAG: zinc-binding protein [Chloroflexi bacterium]|nr:zinc-binding protein [Chloroflexota bacterium]